MSPQQKTIFSGKPLRLPHQLEKFSVIIVPGLRNSDEHHWQSLWQAQVPHSKRIQLDNWETPDLDKWKAAIRTEVNNSDKPAIIIAHSFGTLASASIAAENPAQIAALFLVAPADPDKFQLAQHLPQQPLNVPGKIIASSNDPWLSESKAAYWALVWGTDFLRLKNVGHINSESHLGVWQEGADELQSLLRKGLASAQQHEFAHKKNRAA
ncbi:alpha/beta hydrolase [Cellvibrio sp. UBA7661]|uniref:RBBP9/YdeN family alpha/beta hydrolase n=1 Tax=Cellvibrio sp. UBA7661 TaxID=1946311 RepID=UPI002F353EF3